MQPERHKQPLCTRFTQLIRRHPRWSLVIGGILLIAIAGTVAVIILSRPSEPAAVINIPAAPEPEPEPIIYYSPLTGAIVDTEAAVSAPASAIMIENSPDARPQSGLKQSGVVFEAIAEGGITRFLVLYQNEKPGLVGPVRSLRSYYVDWLAPFDASVAHVGGSAAALAEIRNGTYRDIDQFFNPGAYWRATDRWAPHNVYTNFERLDALNAEKGYASSSPQSFARTDSVKADVPTATTINVTMSSYLYNSAYTYNADTNTYDRQQAGAAHMDREEGQISPRVVVVLKTPMTLVQEDGWRQQYTTIGSGSATIFQDGTVQEVTWHKAAKTSPITFADAAGKDIALARGQTWVTVVPSATGGVTWQ